MCPFGSGTNFFWRCDYINYGIVHREVPESARDPSDPSREHGRKTYGEHRKDYEEHYTNRDQKHSDRMREKRRDYVRDEPRGERTRHDGVRRRDGERHGEGEQADRYARRTGENSTGV